MSSSIDMKALTNCPSYFLTYNKSLPFSFKEGRIVQVDIVKGTSQVPGENLRLGSWKEKVEVLRDVMLETTEEVMLTRDLEDGEFISGGSMTLSFRKAPLGDTFAAEKRVESARRLNTALDWIVSFQKDTGEVFGPNISLGSRNDLSILHAAVYAADKKLVARLLGLGADPTERGTEVGSAQDLCGSLADSSTEIGRSIAEIKLILDEHVASQKATCSERPSKKKRTSRWGGAQCAPHRSESQSASDLPLGPTADGPTSSAGKKSRWAKKEIKLEVEPEPGPAMPLSSETVISDNTDTSSSNSRPNRWGKIKSDAVSIPVASPLSQTTESSNFASPPDLVPDLSPMPVLPSVDWILGMQQRCNRQAKDCPMGPNCPNAHVNARLGLIIDHHPVLANDHAVMTKAAINPQHVHLKQAMDAGGTIWFTAAYVDPATNVICYSERGTGSKLSSQGIYWYMQEDQAMLAVKRVVLIATQAKEELSKRQEAQPQASAPPPPPPPPPHHHQVPPSLVATAPPSHAAPGSQSGLVNQAQQCPVSYTHLTLPTTPYV